MRTLQRDATVSGSLNAPTLPPLFAPTVDLVGGLRTFIGRMVKLRVSFGGLCAAAKVKPWGVSHRGAVWDGTHRMSAVNTFEAG